MFREKNEEMGFKREARGKKEKLEITHTHAVKKGDEKSSNGKPSCSKKAEKGGGGKKGHEQGR